jgi:hypothetical protein
MNVTCSKNGHIQTNTATSRERNTGYQLKTNSDCFTEIRKGHETSVLESMMRMR